MMKLTSTEKQALELLHENDFYVLATDRVMDSLRVNRLQARRALRSLVRKGLAEISPAYDEDDGRILGSGYTTSAKARDILNAAEAPQ